MKMAGPSWSMRLAGAKKSSLTATVFDPRRGEARFTDWRANSGRFGLAVIPVSAESLKAGHLWQMFLAGQGGKGGAISAVPALAPAACTLHHAAGFRRPVGLYRASRGIMPRFCANLSMLYTE